MDPVLKQRLIGAGVIWLLAMIFLPLLLGGERESQSTRMELGLPAEVGAPRETREVRLDESRPAAPEAAPADDGTQDETVRQPELEPEAPAEAVESESPPAAAEEQAESGEAPEPVTTEEQAAPTEAPPPPTGDWFVQVGSFGNPDNARGLRERLEDHGYQALISEYEAGETPLHRVRVGGFADREAAEAVLDELQQRMGLNGRVLEDD